MVDILGIGTEQLRLYTEIHLHLLLADKQHLLKGH